MNAKNRNTKTIRILVTIDAVFDEELRDDQIEQVALESIYVKNTLGIIGDHYYRSEETNREVFYYEP